MKNIVPMKIDELNLVADMGMKGVSILWILQFLKLVIKIKMFLCFYSFSERLEYSKLVFFFKLSVLFLF